MTILAVVLAGGRSTRMGGGDKALRLLAGRPLLAHVLERVRPQVSEVLLNANGDPARFAGFDIPVAADGVADFAGPLAGLLTGMEWALAAGGIDDVVTVPTDAPFLPPDLVARLIAGRAAEGAELACAASGGRLHPVVGLWPIRLACPLRAALAEGVRKMELWARRYPLATVSFADTPVDPFFNANRPADIEAAEQHLRS